MKYSKFLIIGIFFITIIFCSLINIQGSVIYQDGEELVLKYEGLPSCFIDETVYDLDPDPEIPGSFLEYWGFTYESNIIKANLRADYEEYKVYIIIAGEEYDYDRFLNTMPTDDLCGTGGDRGTLEASNFKILMTKYRDIYLEHSVRSTTSFAIYRSWQNKFSFADKSTVGEAGDFQSGVISCKSCYIGNIISNIDNTKIKAKNIKISFVNSNKRVMIFSDDGQLISYEQPGVGDKKSFKIITEGKKPTFYKLKIPGWSNAIEGTFKLNDIQINKGIAELFSTRIGYLFPSTEQEDGLAIIENTITDPETGQNYYLSSNYPNYFSSQINEEGISFSPINEPTEEESTDLLTSILDFLNNEITEEPKFETRSTKIESPYTKMYICQTKEECFGYISS